MRKTFLLSLLALALSAPAWAYDITADGICYNILSEDDFTCEVVYFSYSAARTGVVVIPEYVFLRGYRYSVVSIGEYAFCWNTRLEEVTIPNSVTSIGSYAFAECTSLTKVTIGNAVTSIGDHAFWVCKGLTELTIGNAVTSIGEYAFQGCSSLTEVTIPNSVTSIGTMAFQACSKLKEITLSEKLESIGVFAFDECTNLSIVTSLNPEPPACERYYTFSYNTYNNGILYVPLGTVQAYAKNDGWKDFKNIVRLEDPIPPTVTTIDATDITYSSATLYGSVVSGNEDILYVGFEYWTDGGGIRRLTTSNIDEGMFSATLNETTLNNILADDTNYYYRAYAETDSGTYYGEELSFTTDVNGIDGIANDGAEFIGYYSTDGQQITSPTKGVNIVRLSDGTTKKVLVK